MNIIVFDWVSLKFVVMDWVVSKSALVQAIIRGGGY